jgi:hypothetical protein
MRFLATLFAPQKARDAFCAAQEWLKGKKTYLAASVMLLQACAALADQFCALHGVGDLVSWVSNFASNDAATRAAQAFALMFLRNGIATSLPPRPAQVDSGAAPQSKP